MEATYPAELLPSKLEPAEIRLEKPLVQDPLPPRNSKFNAAKGTWSKGDLTFKLIGFTINEGMVATAEIQVTNNGRSEHRIAIDAVGGSGFQAPPTILATLEDSSGTSLACRNVRGAYYRANIVGMSDFKYILGETAYDPLGVGRWIQAMNEVEAGKDHVITPEIQFGPRRTGFQS